MSSPGIFLCHDIDPRAHQELQVLSRLRQRLEETGATVIIYPGRASDEGFLSFLNQALPESQWFLLFQTSSAVQSYQVRMAVNTALKLVEQRRLQGVLRFIASPDQPEVPAEWSSSETFDGSYDYPRAIEKLLLALHKAPTASSGSTGTIRAIVPSSGPGELAQAETRLQPRPDYDRPVIPPSGLTPLRHTFSGFYTVSTERGRVIIGLSFLLVATLVLGTVMALLLARPAPAKQVTSTGSYGQVDFFNTGLTGADNTTGVCDGLEVSLQNLAALPQGESYYAWLLPDKNEMGSGLLLARFSPVHGGLSLRYISPNHQNLFASYSRFLVTEESASLTPDSPTPDLNRWRYYAEIPQTPDPQAQTMGNMTVHYSDLDHLRHLLSGEPRLDQLSLHGGLSVWFFQNVSKVFEWASAANSVGPERSASEIRQALIKILDYLDGTELVGQDVPPGTPILVDPTIGRVPLLTLDENALPVPGYIRHIELHLVALTSSPHASAAQRTLAGQLDTQLNRVKASLDQARQDAAQLVKLSSKKLLSSSAQALLEDLEHQAMTAFIGEVNPATGTRIGGAIWIFDHIPELATLTVTAYKG